MQKVYLILLLTIFSLKTMEQEERVVKTKMEAELEAIRLSQATPISTVLGYAQELSASSDILPNLEAYTDKIIETNKLTQHIAYLLTQPISDSDRERLKNSFHQLTLFLRNLQAKSTFLITQLARGWRRGMTYQPSGQHLRNANVPDNLIRLIMDVYDRVDNINAELSKVTGNTQQLKIRLLYLQVLDLADFIQSAINLLASEIEKTPLAQKKSILNYTITQFNRLLNENKLQQAFLRSKFSWLKGEQ